jgi:hypothetical protein
LHLVRPASQPPHAASAPATGLPATTNTTTRTCRNSSDPACGPFRWDPDPGPNQPLTGQVTSSPASPSAGEPVTFHVTASDPDDSPVQTCNVSYGDGQNIVCDPIELMDPDHHCPKQYGPWTPPARNPGSLDTTDQHTYQQPGSYDVTYTVHSGSYCNSDPYASSATVKTTVIVAPNPGPPATPQ